MAVRSALGASCARISRDPGPLKRTTPIPPRPGGVEIAAMVSSKRIIVRRLNHEDHEEHEGENFNLHFVLFVAFVVLSFLINREDRDFSIFAFSMAFRAH